MHLNPRQEAAALDIDRHVLVAAGAGTGKTRCVVARLLYLLGVEVGGRRIPAENRLALRDFAAITFTNSAAADLQRQLREALAEAGRTEEASQVDTARIGTIHGFCGRILWEFALQVDRPPASPPWTPPKAWPWAPPPPATRWSKRLTKATCRASTS